MAEGVGAVRHGKVIKYELEDLVLDARRRGRSNAQIAGECNEQLVKAAVKDTLTAKAVERYLATLDRATVPEAHQPQVAAENARLAIDVAERMGLIDGRLRSWLDEAEDSVIEYMVGHGEGAYTQTRPDWHARLGVAKQLRQVVETVVNILERIHNAEQIAAFQEELVQVIRDADPETAKLLIERLQARQSVHRAALIGAPA